MSSLSRLALVLALPLLGACTVYTPAEYRYLEESRSDSTHMNRAAADGDAGQDAAPKARVGEDGPLRSAGQSALEFKPAAYFGQPRHDAPRAAPVPEPQTARNEG